MGCEIQKKCHFSSIKTAFSIRAQEIIFLKNTLGLASQTIKFQFFFPIGVQKVRLDSEDSKYRASQKSQTNLYCI